MLVVYYGYVGLIAFDKELLAQRLGSGVTTLQPLLIRCCGGAR